MPKCKDILLHLPWNEARCKIEIAKRERVGKNKGDTVRYEASAKPQRKGESTSNKHVSSRNNSPSHHHHLLHLLHPLLPPSSIHLRRIYQMRTTSPPIVSAPELTVKMPSEQRATETGVTDRDLALAHTQTQTKFCALCHGTLSPSSIETEYNASGLQAMEDVLAEDEGVAVRDGRYMSIDVDIEADSDMGDAPADDALDMAALCSACRERAVAPYANGAQAVNGAVRGARYALSRPPMVVGLETTTVMPSPPPSLLDSPVPFIQERSSIPPAVAVSLPKLRPTVSIPSSPCDTPSSSSSPSETHLRKTIRDRSTSPVAFVRHASPNSTTRYAPYHDEQLDPTLDITRLRVRSNGYKCLYPGASFQGTQKSGRNSYDVSVTIVVSCLFLLSFSRFHTSSGIQHVNSPDIYYT